MLNFPAKIHLKKYIQTSLAIRSQKIHCKKETLDGVILFQMKHLSQR